MDTQCNAYSLTGLIPHRLFLNHFANLTLELPDIPDHLVVTSQKVGGEPPTKGKLKPPASRDPVQKRETYLNRQ